MVVPAGRCATGEDGEAGPDPIMGEGLPSLHAGALLGRRVLQLLLGDDLWAVHGLLRSRRVTTTGGCACRHGGTTPRNEVPWAINAPYSRRDLIREPPASHL